MPDPKSDPSTALSLIDPTRYRLPNKPVRDVDEVRNCLGGSDLRSKVNLLAPETSLISIPEGYAVQFMVVFVAPGVPGYWYKLKNGDFALQKAPLDKIASAAGASTVPAGCYVEQAEPLLWRGRHAVRHLDLTGTVRTVSRGKELDLRDKSPEASDYTAGQLKEARKHGAQLCETKAALRTYRAAFGIKAGYTEEETKRPFLIPRLVFVPDMSDPNVRLMVTAASLGIAAEVYGGRGTVQIAQVVDEGDDVDEDAPPARPALTDDRELRDLEMVGEGREREPVPAKREEAPKREERQQEPKSTGAPQCEVCGRSLTSRMVEYCDAQLGGRHVCMDHADQSGGAK